MVAKRINYRQELNPAQYRAVTATGGPVLVVAGAGSGKTRTLVYRVAWLVEQGIAPQSILLLTFTRRAATEMIGRAASMLDRRCQRVVGGTFHWLANRVLHSYSRRLSFEPNFSVIDRGDAEDVISFLVSKLGLRERHCHFPNKRSIVEIFSKAVNRQESLQELLAGEYRQFSFCRQELSQLRERYGSYKRQQQVMDFDDLLVYLGRLLREHEDICREISSGYHYILVDEYQDTNRLQADIVRHLATVHRNIMVVGDDSQAIYGFRGAHFRNILDFPRLFPDAQIFKLEENFRSTQPILDVANGIIMSAREKYTKCLYTRRPSGPLPWLVRPVDEGAQCDYVCAKVQELQRQGLSLKNMAVLFRASFHSFGLEVGLASRGIAFVKYGGLRFAESAHIKDVLAHLRAWLNPRDRLSWNRMLLLVKQVGSKRGQAILRRLSEGEPGLRGLASYARSLPANHGLHRLVQLFEELSESGLSVSQQVRAVRAYYEPILVARYYDDYPRRLRELDYLQDWSGKYGRLRDFLAEVVLEPPEASLPESEPDIARQRLILSTIHSAKGLEWEAVFIISAVDDRLPSGHAWANEEFLEEERRLFYVAVTRAKDLLFVCSPRHVYDRSSGLRPARLSIFLQQLPSLACFQEPRQPESHCLEEAATASGEIGTFLPGDPVRHPFFGRGKVVAVADRLKLRVLFEDGHTRLLHLDHAPLERLSAI